MTLIEQLKDKYYYAEDSKSGLRFTNNSRKPHQDAGSIDTDSRLNKYKRWRIVLDGKLYLAHRVIWMLCNGDIPEGYEIDHKDGNALNNKLDNLRLIEKEKNRRNNSIRYDNTTGYTGINEHNGGFHAIVKINRQQRSRYFSINKYGRELALQLALQWRQNKINELNAAGADYSDRHGI